MDSITPYYRDLPGASRTLELEHNGSSAQMGQAFIIDHVHHGKGSIIVECSQFGG